MVRAPWNSCAFGLDGTRLASYPVKRKSGATVTEQSPRFCEAGSMPPAGGSFEPVNRPQSPQSRLLQPVIQVVRSGDRLAVRRELLLHDGGQLGDVFHRAADRVG